MSEHYDSFRNFNQSIEAMSWLFFCLIAMMTVHLYTTTPLFSNGVTQWMACIAYVLIGVAELCILYLAISSRIEIYRIDHPKKVYLTEPNCEGAIS